MRAQRRQARLELRRDSGWTGKLRALMLAIVAALVLGLAACGSDDDDDDGGGDGGSGGEQASIKAGMVTDIGGLNDHPSTSWPTRASRPRNRSSAWTGAC